MLFPIRIGRNGTQRQGIPRIQVAIAKIAILSPPPREIEGMREGNGSEYQAKIVFAFSSPLG